MRAEKAIKHQSNSDINYSWSPWNDFVVLVKETRRRGDPKMNWHCQDCITAKISGNTEKSSGLRGLAVLWAPAKATNQ